MWKFVSRRIRDTVERTYNVLEHHRSWTCGEKSGTTLYNQQDENGGVAEQKAVFLAEKLSLSVNPFHHENHRNQGSSSSSSSSSSSEDDFRRQGCEFQQNVVGALTWSSAIVCGWYTSQMLCMRRRHLHQDGWRTMGRCRFTKGLMSPGQAFHSNLLSHWVLNAPVVEQNNRRVPNGWIGRSFLLVGGDGGRATSSLASKVAQAFPVNNDTKIITAKKSNEVSDFFIVPPKSKIEKFLGGEVKSLEYNNTSINGTFFNINCLKKLCNVGNKYIY